MGYLHAAFQGGQRVAHAHAEVVVNVHAELYGLQPLLDVSYPPIHGRRRHHAHGIAEDGAISPRIDGRVVELLDVVDICPDGILGHKGDVNPMPLRILHHLRGDVQHLLPGHPELVFQVQVAAGHKDADRVDITLQTGVDVSLDGPGRRHHLSVQALGDNCLHRLFFLIRNNGHPHIHYRNADVGHHTRYLHLLPRGEVDSGHLLSVSQGFVPEENPLRQPWSEFLFQQIVPNQTLFQGEGPQSRLKVTLLLRMTLPRGRQDCREPLSNLVW